MLVVKNLGKSFSGLKVVDNISFEVRQNEVFGLVGPNGAGKTTTFNLISGFIKPTSGNIFFQDVDITNEPPHIIRKRGIVRTFQQVNVFSQLTVFENLMCGQFINSDPRLIKALVRGRKYEESEKKLLKRCEELLVDFGLEEKRDAMAGQLSYGEQKKLGIAIALAAEPTLLMIDEPAAGLNSSETEELAQFILTLKEKGLTIVLVEHDMKFVNTLCDRIFVLDSGRKVAEGPPREVLNDPRVIEIYLGAKDQR